MASILIIENNARKREWLKKVLSVANHVAVFCQDGEAGLRAFGELRPDAVILTLNLPKIPGDEVAGRIRELPRGEQTPIILTGTDPRIRRFLMDPNYDPGWEADVLLEEPYSGSLIISEIDRQIDYFRGSDEGEWTEEEMGDQAEKPSRGDKVSEGPRSVLKSEPEVSEEEIVDDIVSLKVEKDMLEADLDSLREEKDRLEQEVRRREEKSGERLDAINADAKKLNEEIEDRKKHRDDEERRIGTMGEDLATKVLKLEKREHQLESTLEKLRESGATLDSARDQAGRSREEAAEAEKRRDGAAKKAARLEGEMESARKELQSLLEEIAQVKILGDEEGRKAGEAGEALRLVEPQLERAFKESETKKAELGELQEEIKHLKELKEEGNQKAEEAGGDLRSVETQLERASTDLASMKAELQGLQDKIDRAKKGWREEEKKAGEAGENLNSVESRLMRVSKESEDKQATVRDLQDEIARLKERREEENQREEAATEALRSVETKLEEVSKESENKKAALSDLQEEVARAKQQREDEERRFAEVGENLKSVESQLERVSKEWKNAKEKKDTYLPEIRELQDRLSVSREELDMVQSSLNKALEKKEESIQQAIRVNRRIRFTQEGLARLTDELKEMRQEREDIRKALEAAEEKARGRVKELEARSRSINVDIRRRQELAKVRVAELQVQLNDAIDKTRRQRDAQEKARIEHEHQLSGREKKARDRLRKLYARMLKIKEAADKMRRHYKAHRKALRRAQEAAKKKAIDFALRRREMDTKRRLSQVHSEMLALSGTIKSISRQRMDLTTGAAESAAPEESASPISDAVSKAVIDAVKAVEKLEPAPAAFEKAVVIEEDATIPEPEKAAMETPPEEKEEDVFVDEFAARSAKKKEASEQTETVASREDEKQRLAALAFQELMGEPPPVSMPKLSAASVTAKNARGDEAEVDVSEEISRIMKSALDEVEGEGEVPPGEAEWVDAAEPSPPAEKIRKAKLIPGFESTAEAAQEDELVTEILSKHEAMKTANHFEFLGVPETATEQEVRYAYRWMVKKFYPEKLQGMYSPDILVKAQEVMDRATMAYRTLNDFKSRKKYIRKLAQDVGESTKKDRSVYTVLQAENEFNIGISAVKHQAWHIARQHFTKAIEMFPEEGVYHAYLGWAVYNQKDKPINERTSQAQVLIEKAIGLNPRADMAYYFLGMIYKDKDLMDKASQLFAQAFRCNKNNHAAQNELKILMKRRGRSSAAPSPPSGKKAAGQGVLTTDIDFQRVKNVFRKVFK